MGSRNVGKRIAAWLLVATVGTSAYLYLDSPGASASVCVATATSGSGTFASGSVARSMATATVTVCGGSRKLVASSSVTYRNGSLSSVTTGTNESWTNRNGKWIVATERVVTTDSYRTGRIVRKVIVRTGCNEMVTKVTTSSTGVVTKRSSDDAC
jgi:hypothetical protein